jgi:5,10-methylenetetrahydromethanopterin reductase
MRFTFSNLPGIGWNEPAHKIVELARLCEDVGFDRFAVADYPFHLDCATVMTACLLGTQRIVVESLVTDPYRRHPSLTACAWATMADLAPGRVILGLGGGVESGSRVMIEPWGLERPHPVQAVREAVDVCKAMWRGDPVTFKGQLVRTDNAQLKFAAQPDIPVLIAARGRRMLRLAGEIADIVHLASLFCNIEHQRDNLAHVFEGAQRAGRAAGEFEIDASITVSVSHSRAQARRLARRTAAQTILWMAGAETYSRQRTDWTPPTQLNVPEDVIRALATRWNMWTDPELPDELAAMISDDVLDQLTVAGEPDECVRQLRRLADNLPEVTGFRIKLPPPQPVRAAEDYKEAILAMGEVIQLFGAQPALTA